jgi:dihydrofolate reductase
VPNLIMFNQLSLDGYFVDAHGDMSWAHNPELDQEWDAFVDGNARGGGMLVFGRVTHDLMASYWPTPLAEQNAPVVAERMNSLPKVVFSRTLSDSPWANTRMVSSDPVAEIRRLRDESGPDMAIMGSGTIVTRLAAEGLIDEYQFVIVPVVIGAGRPLFEGLTVKLNLRLADTRSFANGNVLLTYEPA